MKIEILKDDEVGNKKGDIKDVKPVIAKAMIANKKAKEVAETE